MTALKTPDGRYIVVKGRLWRSANPNLSHADRQRYIDELMAARRAVRSAKAADDGMALKAARVAVDRAKRALGERGPTWWNDGTDLNRHLIKNTTYSAWWDQLQQQLTDKPEEFSSDM